jgi:hypothetical protein
VPVVIQDFNNGSFYNLARIDTKKTISVSLTDAQWDYDALFLSSGGAKTTGASSFYNFGTGYTVNASTYNITLTGDVAETGTVEINGYTETTSSTTPTALQYWVSNDGSDTTVHFNSAAASKVVYPSYTTATTATTDILTVQTGDFAAAGSCVVQFPVYSDADATDSTIIAHAQLMIYKVKIMPTYEIGGNYKTASTFKLELQGLDPRRTDSNMWQLIVVPV